MSQYYKHHKKSFWRIEYLILLFYIIIITLLYSTNKLNWINGPFYTIFFLSILLFYEVILKIYLTIKWIVKNFIEDTFFKILYKIGAGKYVVRFIRDLNIDKDDADYRTYKSYMIRKHLARRLIKQQWVNLSMDIGGDSLYLIRHFVHQKKNKIMQEESTENIKKLSGLSDPEFEELLYRLFKSMGYDVIRSGSVTDKICTLILNIDEQKILMYAKRENIFTNEKDIGDALQAEIDNKCDGVMYISIIGFSGEAIEVAKSRSVGLIGKERLMELLQQFLKEKWD